MFDKATDKPITNEQYLGLVKARVRAAFNPRNAELAAIGAANREKVRAAVEAGIIRRPDIAKAAGIGTSAVTVHLKALGIDLRLLQKAARG